MPIYPTIGKIGISAVPVDIEDEGMFVGAAETLNFIGSDVFSTLDVTGNKVNVYIPPTSYASHFGTIDGNTDARVNNIAVTQRFVADNTQYGDWNISSTKDCINNNPIVYNTLGKALFDNNNTVIQVIIYDHEGNIHESYTTPSITSNNTFNLNNITIQISGWEEQAIKYAAYISVTIDIASSLNNSGRFSIEINHITNGLTFSKTQGPMFYDSEPNTQDINNTILNLSHVGSSKYLSGIRYVTIGDIFSIQIDDIDYINSDTYPQNPVIVDCSLIACNNLLLQGSDLTNWTNDKDDINTSYSGDVNVNISNYHRTDISTVTATMNDWLYGESSISNAINICIDTYGNESTPLAEYFNDEQYRITENGNTWDSTQNMLNYDDNKGMVVKGGELMTMRTNWKSYNPGLSSNPDYSTFTGQGTYYRKFIDVENKVRTSVSLYIAGFTLNDLVNEDIEMWIYIPNRFTSWCYVHSTESYDYSTFDGDGDAVRVLSSIQNRIDITFGTLGLNSTYNEFWLLLRTSSTSIKPTSIIAVW